ncbi:MAG TPA: hypothetical protein VM536_05580, partial [Chloroflexia bacterium]|nr:hypothetical protein [Chloroflexia bacterium]
METITADARVVRPPLPQRVARARARTARGTRRETAVLTALAALTALAYLLGFVLPYPLAGNYTTPLLDLAKINHASAESANYFALTWIVSFLAYFLAYRRCPAFPGRGYLLVLAGGALVFNGLLMLMYPTGAADIFDQIFRARELAVYGVN